MCKMQDWEVELLVSTVRLVCDTLPDIDQEQRIRTITRVYRTMQRTLKTFYDARAVRGAETS